MKKDWHLCRFNVEFISTLCRFNVDFISILCRLYVGFMSTYVDLIGKESLDDYP